MKQKKQNTRRTDAAPTTPANAAPYPAYKPSGVEWLGDVPEHWDTVSLKWVSRRYSGGTPDKSNQDYWTDGTIPWLNSGAVNDGYITEPSEYITEEAFQKSSAKWIPKHALVMALAGQGKTKGMVAQIGFETTCNQSMAAIIPNHVFSPRFLYWWIHRNYINLRNLSGGDARDGLNLEMIGSIPCPLPPLAEQAAIAEFLDGATGRIDALVDKKKRLVALLREKRTAMISRAVTQGLDPTAKRKPSAVEWLGDIPEHWEVKQVRRIASRVQTGNTPPTSEERYYEDGTVLWFGPSSFDERIILERPVKLINKIAVEDGSARLFKAGTVMIVGIGATIGKVSSIGSDASCNQQITGVTFKEGLAHSVFITYQMKQLEGTIRAIAPSATLAIFDQNKISGLWLAIPPLSEQQAIADYLDKETGKIDALIAKVEAAIDKLNEYRTAIISAAVTGKIDVREN